MYIIPIAYIIGVVISQECNSTNFIYPVMNELSIYPLYEYVYGTSYTLETSQPTNADIQIIQSYSIIQSNTIQENENIQVILYATTYSVNGVWSYQTAALAQLTLNQYVVLLSQYIPNSTPNYEIAAKFTLDHQCFTLQYLNINTLIVNCELNQMVIIQNNVTTIATISNSYNDQLVNILRVDQQNQLIALGYPYFNNKYSSIIFYTLNLEPNPTFIFYNQITKQNIVQFQLQDFMFPLYQSGSNVTVFILTYDMFYIQTLETQIKIYPIEFCNSFSLYYPLLYDLQTVEIVFACIDNSIGIVSQYLLENDKLTLITEYQTQLTVNHVINYSIIQISKDYILLLTQVELDLTQIIIDKVLKKGVISCQLVSNNTFQLLNVNDQTLLLIEPNSVSLNSITQPLLYFNSSDQSGSQEIVIQANNEITSTYCFINLNISVLLQNDSNIYSYGTQSIATQIILYPLPSINTFGNQLNGPNLSFNVTTPTGFYGVVLSYMQNISMTFDNLKQLDLKNQQFVFTQNVYNPIDNTTILFMQSANKVLSIYSCQLNNMQYPDVLAQSHQLGKNILTQQIYQLEYNVLYIPTNGIIEANQIYCMTFISSTNIQCYIMNSNQVDLKYYSTESRDINSQIMLQSQNIYILSNYSIIITDLITQRLLIIDQSTVPSIIFTPLSMTMNFALFGNYIFVNNNNEYIILYVIRNITTIYNTITFPALQQCSGILSQKQFYLQCQLLVYKYYIQSMLNIQLQAIIELTEHIDQIISNVDLNIFMTISQNQDEQYLNIYQNTESTHNILFYRGVFLQTQLSSWGFSQLENTLLFTYIDNSMVIQSSLIGPKQPIVLYTLDDNFINSKNLVIQINITSLTDMLMYDGQIMVANSGINITVNETRLQHIQQFTVSHLTQSFIIPAMNLVIGQVTSFSGICSNCKQINVTQLYVATQIDCNNIQQVSAYAQISSNNVFIQNNIGVQIGSELSCESGYQFSELQTICPYIGYYSGLSMVISICYSNGITNVFMASYQSQGLTQTAFIQVNSIGIIRNVQFIPEMDLIYVLTTSYNGGDNAIVIYQVTQQTINQIQVITSSTLISAISTYYYYDNSVDQCLLVYVDNNSLIQAIITQLNGSVYSISKQMSYNISNYKDDKYQISQLTLQQVAITSLLIGDPLVSIQLVLTTSEYYVFGVTMYVQPKLNEITALQLSCTLSPYGYWQLLNQITTQYSNLVLVFKHEDTSVIGIYNMEQCYNDSIIDFTIGFNIPVDYNTQSLPILLYSNNNVNITIPNSRIMTVQQQNHSQPISYSFHDYLNVTIEIQNTKLPSNASVYLVANNDYYQQKLQFFLLGNVVNMQFIAWWVWVLMSCGMVLLLLIIGYLILRSKRMHDHEQQLLNYQH